MIQRHRTLHKLTWIILAPALMAAVLLWSNVDRDLYPLNEQAQSEPVAQALTKESKGALP